MEDNRFPQILKRLLKKRQTTQSALAKAVGRSPQSVTNWCDGSTAPDWETMIQIADVLNVSVDDLLGRNLTQSPVSDVDAICDYTGLSEDAVQYLHILRNSPHNERLDLLSDLLETGLGRHRAGGSPGFDVLLSLLQRYVDLSSEVSTITYSNSAEYSAIERALKEKGFSIIPTGDQAEVLFHQRIIPTLSSILESEVERGAERRGVDPES